jgi:hypothetical protein
LTRRLTNEGENMSRSSLTETTEDINSDSGAVLLSLVIGEQLEFPVTLDFVSTLTLAYQYEAVVVEADNIAGQLTKPTSIKPGGIQTTLSVRIPTNRGNWDALQAYNTGEIVYYNNVWYEKLRESTEGVISSTPPLASPNWVVTEHRNVYVRFLSTLGSTWAVAPTVASEVYGFFELRVTEPSTFAFKRTWKPVRGMVELMFSPTHIVADIP